MNEDDSSDPDDIYMTNLIQKTTKTVMLIIAVMTHWDGGRRKRKKRKTRTKKKTRKQKNKKTKKKKNKKINKRKERRKERKQKLKDDKY